MQEPPRKSQTPESEDITLVMVFPSKNGKHGTRVYNENPSLKDATLLNHTLRLFSSIKYVTYTN